MMNRIIFVGVHNKPETNPLCKFTKSGKVLQKIIDVFPNVDFIKTNLYDLDHFPSGDEAERHEVGWHWRILPNPDDLIILLGAYVHENFVIRKDYKVKRFAHPSSRFSHIKKAEYQEKMITAINDHLTKQYIMKVLEKIDWGKLKSDYIDKKLINANKHPKYDIWILNYTPEVQCGNLWDEYTIDCRGLVIDGDGNILARPFEKFLNY